MGKVIVSEFVSLDGVFEDPGGSEHTKHGGWQIPLMGEDAGQYKFRELQDAGALLLGRVTYEGFAKAWPLMEGTGEFGELMNGLPKYVVSTTLSEGQLAWNNSHVLRSADEVKKLTGMVEKDIVVGGSGQLVRSLMAAGLVDEYRLMIHPIVLGDGKRLFESAELTKLTLADTKTFSTGITLHVYAPVRA